MLRRKLWRELRQSALLLIAVGAIMAVGVTCFIGLQSAYFNLDEARDRYYRQCRMADFWVELKKAPETELQERMRIPGVGQWRARIQFNATVDLPEMAEPINAKILSLPETQQQVINGIVLRQGNYFSPRRLEEVIVNDAFARAHRIHSGDVLNLVINNRRQQVSVVGTAISSEFTYLLDTGSVIPDPRRFGVFYVKQQYAEEVYDFDGAANQVVGMLSPAGRLRSEAVLRELEEQLQDYGVLAAIPQSQQTSDQFLSNEITGLRAFATVTPIMFLITAALVLNVFLGRLARQQRTVVGTLKAIGYEDDDIFYHFLTYGLVVGVIGGVVGSLLGYLASTGLTAVYVMYFEFPSLRSDIYPVTHAIGITVSVLCALAGSLRAARQMLKLRPAEAMRAAPPRRGGAVWLEHVSWIWNRLSASWRMVVRNVLRGRWRTWTAAFAAMAGAALLVNGFMMVQAQNFMIDFQFEKVLRSDIDLVLTNERNEAAWDELRRLPGVQRVEPVMDLVCTLEHGPYRRLMAISGLLPSATLTVPRHVDGSPVILPETGLVLNRRLAELLRVQPGQTVTVRPMRGERRPRQAQVAQVSDSFIGLAAYGSLAYVSSLVNEPFVMTGAQLQLDPGTPDLQQLYRQLKRTPGVQSIQVRRENVEMLKDTLLKNQYVLIVVIVGFAGVIFFGSIVNSSFVNLHERRREVASLRALGYTPWQIGSVFLREALIANVLGTIAGLPAGYGLVYLTALSYESDFLRLPVVWAHWITVTTIVVALIFTFLAHLLVQRAINRLNIRQELNVLE